MGWADEVVLLREAVRGLVNPIPESVAKRSRLLTSNPECTLPDDTSPNP